MVDYPQEKRFAMFRDFDPNTFFEPRHVGDGIVIPVEDLSIDDKRLQMLNRFNPVDFYGSLETFQGTMLFKCDPVYHSERLANMGVPGASSIENPITPGWGEARMLPHLADEANARGEYLKPEGACNFWSGGFHPDAMPWRYINRQTIEAYMVMINAAAGKEVIQSFNTTPPCLNVVNQYFSMPPEMINFGAVIKFIEKSISYYAESARGGIQMAVDDSDIGSYFRGMELNAIMGNPNITTVTCTSIDVETGELVAITYRDRKQWVEAQKDRWVDSIIDRIEKVAVKYEAGLVGEELLKRFQASFVDEMLDIAYNVVYGNPMLEHSHFSADDRSDHRTRELTRLSRCMEAIQSLLPDGMLEGIINEKKDHPAAGLLHDSLNVQALGTTLSPHAPAHSGSMR